MHEDQNKNLHKQKEGNLFFSVILNLYANINYLNCTNYQVVDEKFYKINERVCSSSLSNF